MVCGMEERSIVVKGSVSDVRKQVIPKMYVTTVQGEDGSIVEFDTHEELVTFNVGDRVEVVFSTRMPDYREGEDFLGRGTVVSLREEAGRRSMLVSVGGLLFIYTAPEGGDIPFMPTEKVFVKVAKL